jgi:hypothetical protein
VRDGIRIGKFESVDVDGFATRFAALVDGLAIQVMLDDPDVTSDGMRDLVLGMAELELGVHFEALSSAGGPP